MKDKKCDLCGVDDAVRDGLLCPSCREAIARLLAINEHDRGEQNEAAEAAVETVDHPETKENTRKARW